MKALNFTLFKPTKDLTKRATLVTTSSIFNQDGDLHEHGLYSRLIFGDIGTEDRYERYSFIKLNTMLMEPLIYSLAISLSPLYKKMINRTIYVKFDKKVKDFIETSPDEGSNGLALFFKHFKDIKFKETESTERQEKVDVIYRFINEDKVFIDHIIVIPAGYRDIEMDDNNRPIELEINDLYKTVLGVTSLLKNVNDSDIQDGLYDEVLARAQDSITSLLNYGLDLLDGKTGLTRDKFTKRAVSYGTANVLVGSSFRMKSLKSPEYDMNTITMGVFQFLKAIEPIALNRFKDFISDNFIEDSTERYLYDIEKKRWVQKTLSGPINERWTTDDGRRKILNLVGKPQYANEPIMINEYYLKPVCQIGDKLHIYSSIEEVPKDKPIRGLTYIEMFYLLAMDMVDNHKAVTTRYPFTGRGSIVPSKIALRGNVESITIELTDTECKDGKVYKNYPDTGTRIFQGLTVDYSMLAGFGGDHDGDKMNTHVTMTPQANKEISDLLNDLKHYIGPDGKLVQNLSNDIVDNVAYTLNLDPRS